MGGCLPERAEFEWGLSTSRIVGTVRSEGDVPAPEDVLIVVFRHQYLLEKPGTGERVYRTSAQVTSIDAEGRYTVPMPSHVVGVDILFIAANRLSDEFQFRRQIGIGEVTYRAELPPHPAWHNHYYSYVQPILTDLVTEERYRLSPDEQYRLGTWMERQQDRLAAQRESRSHRREEEAGAGDGPPEAGAGDGPAP